MAAEYRANYYMHDDVVALLAHCFGRVCFMPKKLMLYRQHESNATGNINHDFSSHLRRIFNRNLFVLSAKHYSEKESFYSAYKDDLDDNANRLFAAYLSFPQKGLLGRILIIILNRFSIGGSMSRLLIKTILRRPIG